MYVTRSIFFIFSLLGLLAPQFVHAHKTCIDLFSKPSIIAAKASHFDQLNQRIIEGQRIGQIMQRRDKDKQHSVEQREPNRSWTLIDGYGKRVYTTKLSILPATTQLSIYASETGVHTIREQIVDTKTEKKLQLDEIPIDETISSPRVAITEKFTDSVIDATLQNGRELFFDILEDPKMPTKVRGVFIFVDINNLGWINKNFLNGKVTGDQFITAVSKSILKIMNQRGLVFRLGGDEFGIIMPTMSPDNVQNFMNELLSDVKKTAHQLFRDESIRRSEEVKSMYKALQLGLDNQAHYLALLNDFKNYVSYSQEGLSIGAAYIDGRPAIAIQKEAEDQATQMKIVVKQSQHLDVSKYTETSIQYSGAPKLSFKYKIPKPNLKTEPSTSNLEAIQHEAEASFDYPLLQKIRDNVLYRFGDINIVKYLAETGKTELRVEHFSDTVSYPITEGTPRRLQSTKALPLNSLTNFIDANSRVAKELIQSFTQYHPAKRAVLHINLLNLGKLNYFKDKTLTGDRMIKRLSEVLYKNVRVTDIPFKLPGSEFMMLFEVKDALNPDVIRERLMKAIENDAQIKLIFQEQIDYLKEQLEAVTDAESVQKFKLKISQVEEMKNSPTVIIKTLFLNEDQKMTRESVMNHFR